jgi:hypothetical protein
MTPRLPPYAHQTEGIRRLIERVEPEIGRVLPGCFSLFDEPGAGKSKQVVDAALTLFHRGDIDTVIVVAPAYLRRLVWYHPELGELVKHLWNDSEALVSEYHGKDGKAWTWGDDPVLRWYITNYEYIRNADHLAGIMRYSGPKTLLVLDESSAIQTWNAQQTRAIIQLRKRCGWVWLLNGTPGDAGALFSQAYAMDPRILGCSTWFHFRARYAIIAEGHLAGGAKYKYILGWRHQHRPSSNGNMPCCELSPDHRIHAAGPNVEEIQAKMAPYVLRRLKADCMDLPPKLPPTTLEAVLTKETWKVYKEIQEDFITWLDANAHATAAQAGVRAMRLSQVTAGFLGGVQSEKPCHCVDGIPDPECMDCDGGGIAYADEPPRRIGTEKIDLLSKWLLDQGDPRIKLIVWCRFRFELRCYYEVLENRGYAIGQILGGQRKDEREEAVRLLDPRFTPPAPVIVLGIPSAGGLGLSMVAAHQMIYASPYPSARIRTQSEDRIHRPGQIYPVWYGDFAATGPKGEPTVDHVMIAAQRQRLNVAEWTASAWRKRLS